MTCHSLIHQQLWKTWEKSMLSHLGSKALVFAALSFVAVLQIPEVKADTVRDLREDCLVFLDIMNSKNRPITTEDALQVGGCLGEMKAEIRWRNTLCTNYNVTGDEISGTIGRRMLNMGAGQTAQAFVNWANDNPEFWNESLFSFDVQKSMFSKFKCK